MSQGGSLVPVVHSCKLVAYKELFSLLAFMKETIFFNILFEACVHNNTNAVIVIHDYIFMKCNFFCEICENNVL